MAEGPTRDGRRAGDLRVIAQITVRSRSWVQAFANDLYRAGTTHEPGPRKKVGPLSRCPGRLACAGGKGVGITNRFERFWCTVCQRYRRFVRKTLSFSKCLRSHLGVLWYFIRSYTASLY